MARKCLSVRSITVQNLAACVLPLRQWTGLPVSQIATALKESIPIPVTGDWTSCNSVYRRELIDFLARLDAAGVKYELILGVEVVSREFIERQVSFRASIELETERLMDLESGEPSPETLDWMRNQARLNDER